MLAVTQAVRAHRAFLPVASELQRAQRLPAGQRQAFWRAYRGARQAIRQPYQPHLLGQALAELVRAGCAYEAVAHGLRLARAASLAQLRVQGAEGRVQRALVTESFHLARQAFRAQLGFRESIVDPRLQFGQIVTAADWVAFSDGSYRPGRAAVGVSLKQTEGDGCAEVSLTLAASCPLDTELAAAIVALQTLHALGARRIDLNIDSLGVFRAFESRLPLKYCVHEAEMTRLVERFEGVTVTLVPRLHNHVADRLAAKSGPL